MVQAVLGAVALAVARAALEGRFVATDFRTVRGVEPVVALVNAVADGVERRVEDGHVRAGE